MVVDERVILPRVDGFVDVVVKIFASTGYGKEGLARLFPFESIAKSYQLISDDPLLDPAGGLEDRGIIWISPRVSKLQPSPV